MKLYYSRGACSFAPHIVLRECQLPYTPVRVDTATHKTEHGEDYYAINAKGQVPVLELDDGERLTEGPVIVQYICDRAGRQDLMPAPGSMARYRVMEWQNYVSSELHKSFSPLFRAEFDDATKALFSASLLKKYTWVDQQLRGRAYLTGDTYTGADPYLYTVTQWAKPVKLDLKHLGALQEYLARVGARPAVHEALHAEGRTK